MVMRTCRFCGETHVLNKENFGHNPREGFRHKSELVSEPLSATTMRKTATERQNEQKCARMQVNGRALKLPVKGVGGS